jgi:DNA ligase-1
MLTYQQLNNLAELEEYEEWALLLGYEGVMLRDPNGPYKQGRSSTKEGILLKLKRYEDAECVITGFEELEHNGNEAKKDALGHTKRSSHQENQVGGDTLGALVVKGLTAFEGIEFKIGTGFDFNTRKDIWNERDLLKGEIVKFKYFAIGVKDAPRHPVFIGFRDASDL